MLLYNANYDILCKSKMHLEVFRNILEQDNPVGSGTGTIDPKSLQQISLKW